MNKLSAPGWDGSRRLIAALLALLLCGSLIATPGTLADDDNPSIAILRFGPLPNLEITEGAILDILESYGFISADENRILEERRDLAGENITIHWGDAGFDFPSLSILLQTALDKEPDALITLGTSVSQNAINATMDMDEPTPVLFTSVAMPFDTGIADAPCVKPDHVTGISPTESYEFAIETLLRQDPDIQTIGALFNTSEAGSLSGLKRMQEAGEALGVKIQAAAVTTLADLRPATESLVSDGAEAIVVSGGAILGTGLPVITEIANEIGLPVFYPSFSAIYYGVTIGAGASPFYDQGLDIGRLLTAHLNGEIDIARTAISSTGKLAIGVNLDSAGAQGVEISDELLEEAAAVMKDGRPAKFGPELLQAIARRGIIIPLEQRIDEDRAWLESLYCSDEMIAEQQAELDAADA